MSVKYVTMKVANMRKSQSFILYPYSGGDTIFLQSIGTNQPIVWHLREWPAFGFKTNYYNYLNTFVL